MAAYRPLVRIDGETHVLPDEDRVPVAAIEGAVADDDARLTDAREWAAETVSQVEAETRTATTRRAWTAQRVGQAIAAWWATVGTTVGKALVNLTNPSAIRFIRINADNSVTARTAAEFRSDIGAGTGSGTVTSVGLSVPTGFSIANSPVTGAGTLTLTFAAGYQGYTTAEAIKLADIADNANNYTLPAATATVLGGIELFSNTVQSVAANAVSATASRTYGVQVNSDGQAVVNVPWVDTNTTYSGSTSITLSSGSFQRAALSGDVTASANSNATTIANNAVSNAKLADMVASSIKGRVTAGTGDPEDLTAAQVRTLLNVADGATTNQTDAYLLARANHTGTQPHTTITGLGTAATANVTTSTSDQTAGRVLRVADFNLGSSAELISSANLNSMTTYGHHFISASGQTHGPLTPAVPGLLEVRPVSSLGSPLIFQKFLGWVGGASLGRVWTRVRSDGSNWTPWVELYGAASSSIVPISNGGTGATWVGAARTNLGLGTAATANVTTSATDTAAGRVLTVGYGGLHVPTPLSDFSTLAVGQNRNVLFSSSNAPTDRPVSVAYFSGITFGHNVGGWESVLAFGANDGETAGAAYIRNKVSNVWQPWRRVLDSRSLVTGDGDTTANRIPTVSWVQSYAASTDVATTSTNGLMSAADKTKLDNAAVTNASQTISGTQDFTGIIRSNQITGSTTTNTTITLWGDSISFGVVGSERARVDTDGVLFSRPIRVQSTNSPQFRIEGTTTGLGYASLGGAGGIPELRLVVDGVDVLYARAAFLRTYRPIQGDFGSATEPSFSFANRPNSGIYYTSGNNTLRFAMLGTSVASLTSAGQFSAVSLTETSSLRHKDNIEPYTLDLDDFAKLNPVRFLNKKSQKSEIGFIAEEMHEAFPEFVGFDSDGEIDSINYGKITAVLTAKIQDQDSRIKELEDKINHLMSA